MIANGIVMSKMIYLIQLWGGCSKYLLKCLQLLQNRTARIVTKKEWSTPIKTLLLQCGWMSINQLVVYHSLVLMYQIKKEHKPLYFSSKINVGFNKQTRLATDDGIRLLQRNRYSLSNAGFIFRASGYWNALPPDIRQKKDGFKRYLRAWIVDNVALNP